MEVSGVRSSWDMSAKKSDFILSTSFSLLHMVLNAWASAPISGEEGTLKSASKTPSAMSFVFFCISERGRVMLLVISTARAIPNSRDTALTTMAVVRARLPASLSFFTLSRMLCWLMVRTLTSSSIAAFTARSFSFVYHVRS